MTGQKKQHRFCSFCGKESEEVFLLIAGPFIFICDECVEICTKVVTDERIKRAAVEVATASAPTT